MKKIKLLILLLIFSLGFTWTDGRMYTFGGNETVTVAWDPSPGATYYEYRLALFKRNPISYLSQGTTTDTRVTHIRPRTDFFRSEVRACNDAGCSIWAESTDPKYATVDGQPMSWWIYWEMPKVEEGGIS